MKMVKRLLKDNSSKWKAAHYSKQNHSNETYTRSMVYNGTGYKGNFGPSTEALFSE